MKDETLCIGAIVVAVLMIGGLSVMTWLDERDNDKKKTEEILTVSEGDEISVDYTGRFLGPNGELGALFDTTIPEDARNDSIPKAITFEEKPTYDDMTFTVGSGQMIKGFDRGVLGMTVGSEKYITVPPEDGYGYPIPELYYDLQSKQSIPLREEIPADKFPTLFPQVDPDTMSSFIHPFWSWEVLIIDHDPEKVVLLNQPVYMENYGQFPWNVTVTDISTSRNVIQLTHHIEDIDPDSTLVQFPIMYPLDAEWADAARAANQGNDPPSGRIASVGGVITIDFNREVVGRTLVFKVRVNDIKRE